MARTSEPPASTQIEAEFSVSKPPEPTPEGAVTIDGKHYYPGGDPFDRAGFLLASLNAEEDELRRVMAETGMATMLRVADRQFGRPLQGEALRSLFLALQLGRVEERGYEEGRKSRLSGVRLGEPNESDKTWEQFHARVGYQIAENLRARKFLTNQLYVDAFKASPRSRFLLPGTELMAYEDAPIGIGFEQSNSQPSTVARQIEWLQPEPGHRIMEVGVGSGWPAAILRHVAGAEGRVFGTEVRLELIERAKKIFAGLPHCADIELLQAEPGVFGWAEKGPFDRILYSAQVPAGKSIPEAIRRQLKVGARLVLPYEGGIKVCEKLSDSEYHVVEYPGYTFVKHVETAEDLEGTPRIVVIGEGSERVQERLEKARFYFGKRVNEPPFDISTEEGKVLQKVFAAYESDLTIVLEDGRGQLDRRIVAGAALAGAFSRPHKEVWLVGRTARRSEYAALENVWTFRDEAELMDFIDRKVDLRE